VEPHYANVFTATRGECFRMVSNDARMGSPAHCKEPVKWVGTFVDARKKRHRVWACDGHVHDVERPVWAG
jgi:hypothetical protein